MGMKLRTIATGCLAIALLTVFAPTVSANDGPHTVNEELSPTFTGYAWSDAHDYTIANVPQGATVDASLDWSGPATDLDLYVFAPAATCQITEIPCVASLLASNAACEDEHQGETTLGPSEESVTKEAPVSGTYTISVQASLGVPTQPIPYTLTFSVDEPHGAIEGPESTGYIDTGTHCRAV